MRLYSLIVVVILISCRNDNDKNVTVPEDVKKRSDSLSREVLSHKFLRHEETMFLLRNVQYHSFTYGPKEQAYAKAVSGFSADVGNMENEFKLLKSQAFLSGKEMYDVDILTSSYLIKDIKLSGDVSDATLWKKDIPFDVFCNYVLPYRIGKEYISDWRTYYLGAFLSDHDSAFFKQDLEKSITDVHQWLYKRKQGFQGRFGYSIPDLPLDITDKLMIGTCLEISKIGVSTMRALGIPAAIDFTPNFLNANSGHAWCAAILDTLHCIPFDVTTATLRSYKNESNTLPKVYRESFAPVTTNHFHKRGYGDYLPPFLNSPFLTDVTASYTQTSNIDIELDGKIKDDIQFCYLTVFNGGQWDPVDWGIIKDNVAHFENIGRGGVYLPVTIESDGTDFIGSPFLLGNDGSIKFLKPDTLNTISMELYRKFRPDKIMMTYLERMIGGKFQGSDYPDFRNATDLYIIDRNPGEYFNTIKIDVDRNFKYLRYYSPVNSFGNVAEVEFYGQGTNKDRLQGKIIGTKGSWENNKKGTRDAAFDGDLLTFFDSNNADNSWVGLALKNEEQISAIRFIARTDLNAIQPDNIYELFYWNNGWQSLGKRKGASPYLEYKGVPGNALFWLRNLTGGVQERIFIYDDNKQRWM